MMVWKFCEQEIYSSPPNSSSQHTSSNDFVLLSLMYKNARDTLLHSSVSQFTDLQKTSNSAELHRGDEGPGRRGRRESESPCHEAGLRRAASIGAATAVRSARGCKRTWEPRDAVTRGAARGPRREGVGATGPGRRRGSVRTGAAALR